MRSRKIVASLSGEDEGRRGDRGVVRSAFVPGIDYSDHASYWEAGYPAAALDLARD